MKSLQAFVVAVERWCSSLPGGNSRRWFKLGWISNHRPDHLSPLQEPSLKQSGLICPKPLKPAINTTPRTSSDRRYYPQLVCTLTVVVLTGVLGQRFYNQPGLQVGSIAPQTIYAPDTAAVEDRQTTADRRRDARNGTLPVLKLDIATTRAVFSDLNGLIAQINRLRQQAGLLPLLPTDILSTPIQAYLRSCEDGVWFKLRGLIIPLSGDTLPSPNVVRRAVLADPTLSPQLSKAINELWAYRQVSSAQDIRTLVTTLEQSRESYKQAQADLILLTSQRPGLTELAHLLNLSTQDWAQAQMAMHRVAEQMLTQGIPLGLPPELVRRAVAVQIKGSVPPTAEGTAISLLTAVLQPNLIQDSDRTRLQADRAAEAVKPVMVEVSEGDLIVAAGNTISQSQFVLLDHFNLSQRRFNYGGLVLFGSLIAGCLVLVLWIERRSHHHLDGRDYLLVTLMVVASGLLNMFGVVAYGLPAIGMLAGSFYGPALGSALVLMLALVLPIGSSVSGIAFAAGVIGAVVSSLLAERMRSREELAMLGGLVGLTQATVYLILSLTLNPISLWSAGLIILTSSGLQGVYGILSTILALGLSPYLERGFDLITPIRLAELSNPNRPMLKRLASEAPGTFQHTLFVASLAEAAARALGCNVELVRAGTLYHDIGKMHDPLAFIENQMGGPNKHDVIQNPWLSAAIIKKHVTEGLAMARKCHLPRAVQAFIPEHQGTMLISYFHHQAEELAKENGAITLHIEDFRYPGPTPQSPETGIVMLADSCEAALRSLRDATTEEALTMVNRILRARWRENQLGSSGLTREHLAVIAEIFVQVWQQYHHKRIAYPQSVFSSRVGWQGHPGSITAKQS